MGIADTPDATGADSRMDWETPDELFAELHREFRFTRDVCASTTNHKLPTYWSIEDDALTQEWTGVCWMNPPYGRGVIDQWLRKASESPKATVVALIPSRTGPPWWHRYVMGRADEIRFIRGKLRFKGADSVAGFCSAIAVYRRQEFD